MQALDSATLVAPPVRWGLRIRGTVQGVGFRPAVHRAATGLALAGLVRNDAQGVWIEIEGSTEQVARFAGALEGELPPLARIDAVEVEPLPARGDRRFEIVASSGGRTGARIPPDLAPCDDCVRELFDPGDRRFRYPFINCTSCGPRYSIIQDLPYDRSATTMASFAMCDRCRREYDDPSHRRFHAEPNACADCGPRLAFVAAGEPRRENDDALRAAAAALAKGAIVAVRGVGGWLLAVDARDAAAVARLRQRKHRPHKPFALMARDLAEAERVALVDEAAAQQLAHPSRPIVLVPARPGHDVASAVAPGLGQLGLMLPSTPLHLLLLADGPPLLVMTSGNLADEPLARDNDEAKQRLAAVADAFLEHDRPIHTRIDDSVVRMVDGEAQPVRRARGLAPEPIALPFDAGSVLAVGAELKSTVCLTRGDQAFVSQHLGDLSQPLAFALFEETMTKLKRLYQLQPTCIAHDLHPDYRSTRWALAQPLERLGVQHHHAHVASCLVENGHLGPAIGVAFDGTGCAPDGAAWGGEFLVATLAGYRRIGHLAPLPLVGGEAAIRRPWRLAVAALARAEASVDSRAARLPPRELAAVLQLVDSAATTTSAGRWFDAVAALLGVRDEISYEAQAAIELELLAADQPASSLPFLIAPGEPFVVDLFPTVRELARALGGGARPAELAAAFHETLAHAVVAACRQARRQFAVETVALSGGCFQNARLTSRCRALLAADGFEVLVHRRVPPNDGGLSLGQAAIAGYRCSQGKEGADVSRHSR